MDVSFQISTCEAKQILNIIVHSRTLCILEMGGVMSWKNTLHRKKSVKVVSLFLLKKFSVRSFKTDNFLLQTSEGDALI